ncbi:uncharacterized protein LOC119674983 [Teleopsis dalmanni]|uniref:uncharacterized protein LOC119674983 n=1 Tax=Teleopsis dalmanni TaxID=139649 RepID=UPI0018CF9884|nr:uncharacterized protein LOC119674983 [Teleopsis dalmanni]
MSYPLELTSWYIMVPTMGVLSTSDIYLMIIGKKLIIVLTILVFSFSVLFTIIDSEIFSKIGRQIKIRYINLILNDKVLPGILGQSYMFHTQPKPSQRCLYMSLFLLGLTLNTLYAAHLKTLITSHPSLPQILSFDDLRKAKVDIMVDETEVKIVSYSRGQEQFDKIRDLMDIRDTLTFQNQRKNLRTSHAYTVPTSMWKFIEQQQLFFARALFHAPEAMIIIEMLHLCVPLQENSILKESFDHYIHKVHDAGLLQYWYRSTFREMLSAHKIAIAEGIRMESYQNLRTRDLKWVWIFIGCGYILSIVAFLLELCISSIKSKPKAMKTSRK